MTAPRSRKRSPPSPQSILDRPALIKALDDADIAVRPVHIAAFYQQLHRQHYPPLEEFVETYYKIEQKTYTPAEPSPLCDPVSRKKNRNKVQLSKAFLDFLKDPDNGFVTITSSVDSAKVSKDGTTTKLAIRLHDGHLIESVIMRYVTRFSSRASLCVSSQVGCAMKCTFCATGTMGELGNLTCGEILEQLVHANRILAREARERNTKENIDNANMNHVQTRHGLDLIRNVVYMGMGEPLNNYDNVIAACRAMIDPKRWNLGKSKVTVSTVGVTPRMLQLTQELPHVSLALSLHAPNQEMRSAIVPAAKAYKIEGLIDALDKHMMFYVHQKYNGAEYTAAERIQESTRRRAMIEYVMLEGDTSTLECAHQLGKLCENRRLIVNLIPYNQTNVKDKLKCPSEEHMREFQSIVTSYGAFCTIRRTMGADIDSACGQLVKKKMEQAEKSGSTLDIEDVVTPKKKETTPKTAAVETSKGVAVVRREGAEISSQSLKIADNDKNESVDFEQWIKPLVIATSVAGAMFVLSSIMFVAQRRRR